MEQFKALTQDGYVSAVADQSTSSGHNIKWDHFELLASGQCDSGYVRLGSIRNKNNWKATSKNVP